MCAVFLTSGLLLALINTQVNAQAEGPPNSVLIMGSLIRGGATPQLDPGRLTQLRNGELRAILPGASIRALGEIVSDGFGCDGQWARIGGLGAVYKVIDAWLEA
jgi:hypothetical protein